MPTSLSKAWSGASLEAAMGLVASQHSRHSVSEEQEASMQAELRDSLVLEMGSCDCPLLFFGFPCHEAGSCGGRRAPARQKGCLYSSVFLLLVTLGKSKWEVSFNQGTV